MKKFICGHCGGRIAVTPRHLGTLVVCPDCSKPTHPLAADILAAAKTGPRAVRSPSAEPVPRHCENCSRTIGRLEKLQLWNNHLVCDGCHARLVPAPPPPPAPTRLLAIRRRPEPRPELPEAAAPAAATADVIERKALPSMTALAGTNPVPAKVAVVRAATLAAGIAALPPLPLKQRFYLLLGVICFAGVAAYGALTLLRDLAGFVTTIALILLAAVAIIGLLRTGITVAGRWMPTRRRSEAAAADADAEASA